MAAVNKISAYAGDTRPKADKQKPCLCKVYENKKTHQKTVNPRTTFTRSTKNCNTRLSEGDNMDLRQLLNLENKNTHHPVLFKLNPN